MAVCRVNSVSGGCAGNCVAPPRQSARRMRQRVNTHAVVADISAQLQYFSPTFARTAKVVSGINASNGPDSLALFPRSRAQRIAAQGVRAAYRRRVGLAPANRAARG